MKKEELRIVYMGTPDFAVESLRVLVDKGYNIVGVITMPDKAVGKHHTVLQASPVKLYAESKGIPVLQPEKLKNEDFLSELKALHADLQIVVAFRMLPQVVWDMPRYGTFNLHASLLPQYRGAAPINRAIINGETETGVTTFFLTHEIDTGKIIMQKCIPIADTDDAGIIHDRLMNTGATLVVETVDLILSGKKNTIHQEKLIDKASLLHPAPKIFKETCRIDWNQPVKKIYDFIRGLSPYPVAWTEFLLPGETCQMLKIHQTEKRPETHNLSVGTIVSDNKNYVDIATPDGFIRLLSVQLAGKKRMEIKDFLNGFKQIDNCTIKV